MPVTENISREISYQDDQHHTQLHELRDIATSLLPAYGVHWHRHSLATLQVAALSRILYYNDLYQKIITVPGVICEFGVQWGATLALLTNLRSIHEPFNLSRTIHGFDTFQGFPHVDGERDGTKATPGDYTTADGHVQTLEKLLDLHESFAPIANLKKFELVQGDAALTIDFWLRENPHAIISMAIFDMDLYKPTREVLQKIIPRLTRGSLLVFDELCCKFFPGETIALNEIIGLNNLSLKRSPLQPFAAWTVWGQ